jgi:hypothetical protein
VVSIVVEYPPEGGLAEQQRVAAQGFHNRSSQEADSFNGFERTITEFAGNVSFQIKVNHQ